MTTRQWKKIGKVGKPYGLGGAFYVGGRPNLLPDVYREVVVGSDPQSGVASTIRSYNVFKERAVLRLALCPSRTAIEAYTGQELWAPADVGEHDYSALIGRLVVDCDGAELGRVQEFYNHGASDNVELADEQGRFVEIPFVDSYFELDFSSASDAQEPLRLKVQADLFADLWSPHQA